VSKKNRADELQSLLEADGKKKNDPKAGPKVGMNEQHT